MIMTSFVEEGLSLTEVLTSFHKKTSLEDQVRQEVEFLDSDTYYTSNVWVYTGKQDSLFLLKLSR